MEVKLTDEELCRVTATLDRAQRAIRALLGLTATGSVGEMPLRIYGQDTLPLLHEASELLFGAWERAAGDSVDPTEINPNG